MGGNEAGIPQSGEPGKYFLKSEKEGTEITVIFVTVGTHEQQFDRLIREVDILKEKGKVEDEVIVQTGFSTYEPAHCRWSKLIPYEEMKENIARADIVITHGGPASFIAPLQEGKVPIVVPRQKRFGEHVNDHQLEFCRTVERRIGNIILVEDVGELCEKITNYSELCRKMNVDLSNHNEIFNKKLEQIIKELGI